MSARLYREPEPIGIGSIVIRFSSDGELLDIGQIVGSDESLRSNARWIVFSNGRTRRWHSATILRRLKDWEEAAFVRGAVAALSAVIDEADGDEVAMAATSIALTKLADGSLKP